MKPFLGIDLTTNKKNEQPNGREFLVSQPSAAMTQAFERTSAQAENTVERSKLPLPLRIIQWVCQIVGVIVACSLVKALVKIPIAQAYQNAPVLFWIVGVCAVVWGILKFMSSKKQKTVLESDEGTHALSSLEGVCDAIYVELSVPADAKTIDLLTFFYKEKNGTIKVCEKGLQMAPYMNPIFKAFVDSENLYLANLEGKYAIPLSSLRSIHTVKKHTRIISWNKENACDQGVYKPYKLTTDNYGCVHCKCHHILEVTFNNQSWGIYFPAYELPVFETLTGIKA